MRKFIFPTLLAVLVGVLLLPASVQADGIRVTIQPAQSVYYPNNSVSPYSYAPGTVYAPVYPVYVPPVYYGYSPSYPLAPGYFSSGYYPRYRDGWRGRNERGSHYEHHDSSGLEREHRR